MKKAILILIIFNSSLLNAQWQTDVRLTNNPADSWTSYNNAWCVAANGDFVHVVWYDYRDGNREIYYKRSTDGGFSWGTDKRLTNNLSNSSSPSIYVSGSIVHVVWNDNRDGNFEIYYKRSTDGGFSWGVDTRLTYNTFGSFSPSISISGQNLHIVWHDILDGNAEIYYKRSTDGGIIWGADIRLTNYAGSSFSPSVSVFGSNVHTVWFDDRDGNSEIYYKHSTDGGINWGADMRLTNNPAYSVHPSVSVSGSIVHVVWNDEREGSTKIFYKRSTDAGITWGIDTQLTNASGYSGFPSVASSLQNVHVVWYDFRGGTQIYYKRSTDDGLNWDADIQLSNNTSMGAYIPSIALFGTNVHVVWEDNRDGNPEIYYKRNPTGNPIGIINISSEIPKSFSLSQNYPNPFNPTTKIKFDIPQDSRLRGNDNVLLIVYDMLGREVTTLVNEQIKAGTYEVEWDGSNYSSGLYYYTLLAETFHETKRMVMVK